MGPFGENSDGIKDGAKRGKDVGDHPGEHFNPMTPQDDSARREKREGPTEDKKGGGKREKSPADCVDIEGIEDVDGKRAETDRDEKLRDAEKKKAGNPFGELERSREEIG